jgi:hypothetical protein
VATADQAAFVASSLTSLIDTMYTDGRLNRQARDQLHAYLAKADMPALSEQLFTRGRILFGLDATTPRATDTCFELIQLHELDGSKAPLVVWRPDSSRARPPARLRCFIGHRFAPTVTQPLQYNLHELFELHHVTEEPIGKDGSAIELLPEIYAHIRRADFCLFDNRETTNPRKLNVYLEAAMAYAMRTPFVFCNFGNETMPTDFGGLLNTPYTSYIELFRELYRRMPMFLGDIRRAHARRRRVKRSTKLAIAAS